MLATEIIVTTSRQSRDRLAKGRRTARTDANDTTSGLRFNDTMLGGSYVIIVTFHCRRVAAEVDRLDLLFTDEEVRRRQGDVIIHDQKHRRRTKDLIAVEL